MDATQFRAIADEAYGFACAAPDDYSRGYAAGVERPRPEAGRAGHVGPVGPAAGHPVGRLVQGDRAMSIGYRKPTARPNP